MVSRRKMLAGFGAAGALGVGAAGGFAGGLASASEDDQPPVQTVPFYAKRQAGIVTPQQDRLTFATFDVTATDRASLVEVLNTWTAAAAAMTKGDLVPGGEDQPQAPPSDTGEAQDIAPGHLTVTIGYGPSLFDSRFGLADRKPAGLQPLPTLPGEQLDPAYVGGDICVQACADDPQVSFHVIRNLSRLGAGSLVLRWMQLGFGRTSSTSSAQATPRNLLGFKDGTRNLSAEQADLLDRYVWIGNDSGQSWLQGGSYLVARRIRMYIENWDRDYLADQENVFGRSKVSGAPLTGAHEFDPPNFNARDVSGSSVIPENAHIRLVSHENNNGLRILRRGYSITDGIDSTGNLLGGLFFIAFVRDPEQFITLQRKLGSTDALNEYIQHTGSGVFVCPPGLGEGQGWGTQLAG